MITGFIVSGAVVRRTSWQKGMIEQIFPLTVARKQRERVSAQARAQKGLGTQYTLQWHTLSDLLPLTRLSLLKVHRAMI
jgi:hypothetical protein